MPQQTRRHVLATLGAGCLTAVAGCAGAETADNDSSTESEDEPAVRTSCHGNCAEVTSFTVDHTTCIGCPNHINTAIAFDAPATREIEFVFYEDGNVVNERTRVVEGMAGSWEFSDPAPGFERVEIYIDKENAQSDTD